MIVGQINKLASICLLCALSSNSYAGVYKWIDEYGQVHYGDKPPTETAEEMTLEESVVKEPAGEETDRSDYQQRVLDSLSEERQRKEEIRDKHREEQDRFMEYCQRAKDKLERIKNARYLYGKGEDGDRIILTEEQRAEETKKAMLEVQKNCSAF